MAPSVCRDWMFFRLLCIICLSLLGVRRLLRDLFPAAPLRSYSVVHLAARPLPSAPPGGSPRLLHIARRPRLHTSSPHHISLSPSSRGGVPAGKAFKRAQCTRWRPPPPPSLPPSLMFSTQRERERERERFFDVFSS